MFAGRILVLVLKIRCTARHFIKFLVFSQMVSIITLCRDYPACG